MKDELLDLTVPFNITGGAIRMYRSGTLDETLEILAEYKESSEELRIIEGKLKACHDPNWLAVLWRKWRRKGLDFEQELKALTTKFEAEKTAVRARHHKVNEKLKMRASSWPGVMDSLATSTLSLTGSRRLRSTPNPDIEEREHLIVLNANKPAIEITRILDATFPPAENQPSPKLPGRWHRDFQVNSFLEAYRHRDPKMRNRVRKLISKTKKKWRLP